MVEIDDNAKEENTESFQAEVEQELAFLQSFPVSDLDDKARKEAEKEKRDLDEKVEKIKKRIQWATIGLRISQKGRKRETR